MRSQENEFNLNIPRCVDTSEPEPEIDITAVQQEIDDIETKLNTIREKMDGYLKELGFASKKKPAEVLWTVFY